MKAPTTYTILVEGHLDDHWSTWLVGADLQRLADGTTSLTVVGADQAALHGVLAGLRDIGAVIVEVHTSSRRTPSTPRSRRRSGPTR